MSTRQLQSQCELLLVAAAPRRRTSALHKPYSNVSGARRNTTIQRTRGVLERLAHARVPRIRPHRAAVHPHSLANLRRRSRHDHLLLEQLLIVHGVPLGPKCLSITPYANGEAWVSSRSKFASPHHSAQSKSMTDHDLVDSGSVKPELLQGLWRCVRYGINASRKRPTPRE